ncbi:MAG: DUF3102 domain-containing protein [Clostridium sp.]
MSELMVNRTPELIAAEIRNIKEQTKKVVLYNSVEIGRKLTEAKELIGHGEWGNWLEAKVEYSKSTANNLMQIFKEFGADQMTLLDDNLKSQAFGSLSYSKAILLLGVPEEAREEFVIENNVEDMSTRELKRTIEELKKTKEEKEEALKVKDDINKKLNEVEESNRALEEAFNIGAEERDRLTNQVNEYADKLKELNERQVVIDIEDTKADKELQITINKLKAGKEEAERQLRVLKEQQNDNDDGELFEFYFNKIVKDYQKMLEELENMKGKDEVKHIKYSNATKKFLNAMLERVSN